MILSTRKLRTKTNIYAQPAAVNHFTPVAWDGSALAAFLYFCSVLKFHYTLVLLSTRLIFWVGSAISADRINYIQLNLGQIYLSHQKKKKKKSSLTISETIHENPNVWVFICDWIHFRLIHFLALRRPACSAYHHEVRNVSLNGCPLKVNMTHTSLSMAKEKLWKEIQCAWT